VGSSAYAGRLAALRATLVRDDVAAILVTRAADLRYLIGFEGSAGRLVVTDDAALFATDGRYTTAASALPACRDGLVSLHIGTPSSGLDAVAALLGGTRVAVDPAAVTWAEVRAFGARFAGDLVPVDDPVVGLRAVKDAAEIAALRAAVATADAAFAQLVTDGGVVPGRSELEVAASLDLLLRAHGATGNSFPTIVAAGARGAQPHARPSSATLTTGDVVVMDFGCVVDGYCSDTTRTVRVADPAGSGDPEAAAVYDVVRAAQDAARAAVRAGVAARDVDAAAREVIVAAGYGASFVHGTGHGVGLEIHELPRVSAHSDDVLVEGNVITIEPGVYLPGRFGVRIEDMVVVTADGCETLTAAPRLLAS
jgi:Xaa-Pro aminopeptidase